MFTHFCQCFWSIKTLESDSLANWVIPHSHQWFWSPQEQDSNLLSGCVFIHYHQWFWFAQTLELTRWMCVYQSLLVVWIHSNTRESDLLTGFAFTSFCQWFQSTQTLESNPLSRCKFIHSCQWFYSALESDSQTGCMFTHSFSSVVFIHSNTGKQLTNWMHIHIILVSDCNPVKTRLTPWTYIHSQWFWSTKTLKSDSQPGHIFSQSCQWFWFGELTFWMQDQFVSLIWSDTQETHILDTFIHSSQRSSNTGEQLTS